jgi:hypothetical protein
MKKLITIILPMFAVFLCNAQQDTLKNVTIDLLTTPTNPAFNVMATSPAEIVEPASAPEFILSVQNASNKFSELPNNYGFSVTPFWWTGKARNLSFDSDFDSINKAYFFRNLRISAGVVKGILDNENLWRYGLGLQTAIYPGKVESAKKRAYYNALKIYNESFNTGLKDFLSKNELIIDYNNRIYQLQTEIEQADIQKKDSLINVYRGISNELDSLRTSLAENYEKLKMQEQEALDVNNKFSLLEKRVGFKLDVGAGMSYNIQDNKIDSTQVYRWGIWTNFGYTLPLGKSYLNILGLTRYLHYKSIVYQTDTIFNSLKGFDIIDLGGQVKYDVGEKFSFLFEVLYRVGFDDTFKNTYKINSIAQYKFNKGQLVYISIGNAFNEVSNKGPQDFEVNIGINLGIGNTINIVTKPKITFGQ